MNTPDSPNKPKAGDTLRPHSYDGIQEYDKRLPRWWLLTLYGAIAFGVCYWGYYHTYAVGVSPTVALETEMTINAQRAAAKASVIDDDALWKMSLDPKVVLAGQTTFATMCAACHKPDLTGQIGPNLVDHQWIHGGTPMDAIRTIAEGVPAKGMPAWGTTLGKQKVAELVAFIFSHHQPGEEIIAVPGWTPPPPQ